MAATECAKARGSPCTPVDTRAIPWPLRTPAAAFIALPDAARKRRRLAAVVEFTALALDPLFALYSQEVAALTEITAETEAHLPWHPLLTIYAPDAEPGEKCAAGAGAGPRKFHARPAPDTRRPAPLGVPLGVLVPLEADVPSDEALRRFQITDADCAGLPNAEVALEDLT
jgi:hypothetical protein